jgi:carbon storage regulator CsrA
MPTARRADNQGREHGMLALTRRIGEEIVIGDPKNPLGTIRVVEIRGDKVKLSFDFPTQTQINRKELADEKARQGSPAHAGTSPAPQAAQTPTAPATPGNQTPPQPPATPEPNGNIKLPPKPAPKP